MKLASLLLVLVLVAGCGQVATPPPPTVPPVVADRLDGEYQCAMLPCKCGGLVVYVPGSCTCFDPEFYPDLAAALQAVSDWMQTHGGGAKHNKPVGRYEPITLECGCTLGVFVPKSSGCLSKKYPELETLLENVYRLANEHKEAVP